MKMKLFEEHKITKRVYLLCQYPNLTEMHMIWQESSVFLKLTDMLLWPFIIYEKNIFAVLSNLSSLNKVAKYTFDKSSWT